jgi:hypothetical protein
MHFNAFEDGLHEEAIGQAEVKQQQQRKRAGETTSSPHGAGDALEALKLCTTPQAAMSEHLGLGLFLQPLLTRDG